MDHDDTAAAISKTQPEINCHNWLLRWDRQQAGYLPDREVRFSAMFALLAVLLPEEFVAVDLDCGPSAISQHLVARFTKARCVAVASGFSSRHL